MNLAFLAAKSAALFRVGTSLLVFSLLSAGTTLVGLMLFLMLLLQWIIDWLSLLCLLLSLAIRASATQMNPKQPIELREDKLAPLWEDQVARLHFV